MKKRIVAAISLIITTVIASASDISTTYNKGLFHTHRAVEVNADFNTCSEMIDDFILDFQTDLAHLFTWALKNTGQTHRNDGSDDIVLKINYTRYEPDSGTSLINADFEMPSGFAIRDKDLQSYVHDRHLTPNQRNIIVDFYYSGSLLKKANGTFTLTKSDVQHTDMDINIDIRFGWFFNIFVTQKRYREVLEWRIDTFVDNLKEEAEKRFATKK